MSDIFSKNEPVSSVLGLTSNDMFALFHPRMKDDFLQLSSVAYNPQNMDILGIFLASDPFK